MRRSVCILHGAVLSLALASGGCSDREAEGVASPAAFEFTSRGGGFEARSGTASPLAARVASGGVELAPEDGSFRLRMRADAVGRANALAPLRDDGRATARGPEVIIDRGGGVDEHILAGPLGLEQTFVLARRPVGAGELLVEVAFDGLTPARAADVVELCDASGRARAVYRDARALDAEGRELSARLVPRAGHVEIAVDDRVAVYPIVVDPLVLGLEATLAQVAPDSSDSYGHSVAISGDTAIVGRKGFNGYDGAADVFVRQGSSWTLQQELTATSPRAAHDVGVVVAISGDTVVLAATIGSESSYSGAAFVFVRSAGVWTQQQELRAPTPERVDLFASSLAIDGDTLLVGAEGYQHHGAAFVFTRSGTAWSLEATLAAAGQTSDFGSAAAVQGDTAVVGAKYENAAGTMSSVGAAHVFVRSGTQWTEQQVLNASNATPNDAYGYAVSLDGDTAVVGAPMRAAATLMYAGSSYVYQRSGTAWTEQAALTAQAPTSYGWFGTAVAVKGDTVVVGEPKYLGMANAPGHASLFTRSASVWSLADELSSPVEQPAKGDLFGESVALDGDTAVVGAPFATSGSVDYAGLAFVFVLQAASGAACTLARDCLTGSCVDGVCCQVAACAPLDACHVAGTCQANAGTCSNPPGNDGAACTAPGGASGACSSGACVASITTSTATSTASSAASATSAGGGSASSSGMGGSTAQSGGEAGASTVSATTAISTTSTTSPSTTGATGGGSASTASVTHSSTSATGSGGSGGAGGGSGETANAGGCGCRASAEPVSRSGLAATLALALAALRRRRRRGLAC